MPKTYLTQLQRSALSQANAGGLPFAAWRAPGGAGFTVLVSTRAPEIGDVFGAGPPGFAMAPFDTEDGARAWILAADVLVTAEGARFRDGGGFADRPATPDQARIVAPGDLRPIRATGDAGQAAETRADYVARVARAVERIRDGQCDKIVLSRVEPRDLPEDHDLAALVEALGDAHPDAFVSLVMSAPTGTWLTATPETLLSWDGAVVTTMALAGTQWPDTADGPAADPVWPDKIIREQGIVAGDIRDVFAAAGIHDVEETPPTTVRAGNLYHLRSDFLARVTDPAGLSGLLRRLHPTSAVCGMPKHVARAVILEAEARGFYTGYLGPRGIDGRTALFVNLRSARAGGGQLHLHVGGGIVAGSDPEVEWQETVEKARTIGRVL